MDKIISMSQAKRVAIQKNLSKKEEETLIASVRKRRTKAEIEADKKIKAEKKSLQEKKKAEREKKKLEKEAAKLKKENQKIEDAKVQKIIDKLKIGKEYFKACPMTTKEKTLCKKILDQGPSMSVCHQQYGNICFNILAHRENEFLISIDSNYFFYNKSKNTGINFGSVFNTWCTSTDKIPWTDQKTVNIKKENKNGNNSTQDKHTRRPRKIAK